MLAIRNKPRCPTDIPLKNRSINNGIRPSRVLQGNRIGQLVAIDQRALFAQRNLNFGNEGISFVSIPRREGAQRTTSSSLSYPRRWLARSDRWMG